MIDTLKVCLTALILTVAIGSVTAQDRVARSATDFFVSAPLEVASGLPEISRLDMIDYFTHGSSVKSDNRLGCKVGLVSVSDDLVVWQDEDSVTTSLAVLPAGRDTMLLVIRTVAVPMPDSEITCYDKNWHTVERKVLPDPTLKEWLNDEGLRSEADVRRVLPFILVIASYDPDSRTLIMTNRTSDYYVESDMPAAVAMLKNELRYRWTGSTFRSESR